jgi:hypothetical protein
MTHPDNPLTRVEADGFLCPVLSCAVCGDPVTLTDHAVWTYPEMVVQVVHKGRCDDAYQGMGEEHRGTCWRSLSQFLPQPLYNVTNPLDRETAQ